MKNFRLFFLIFVHTLFLSAFIYLLSNYLSQTKAVSQTIPIPVTYLVTRVIDGDTFEIDGGVKVRLIGVDTPELNGGKSKIQCYALEAKNKISSLILNKFVVLEKDVSETDKYGRLLRYVYLDGSLVNDQLVKEGYARIATFAPDVKHSDRFVLSEREARDENVGLWSSCPN